MIGFCICRPFALVLYFAFTVLSECHPNTHVCLPSACRSCYMQVFMDTVLGGDLYVAASYFPERQL